jgi:MoxR-like ATPase
MRTLPSTPRPVPPAAPQAAAPPAVVPLRGWRAAAIMDDPATAAVLHSTWSGDHALIVPSPPGAGKTRLVALLAVTLAERADLRVGIAAQTRDQALEIARRCGRLTGAARLM